MRRLGCTWAASWITASTFSPWIPGACRATGAPSPHWPSSPGGSDWPSKNMFPCGIRVFISVCVCPAPAVLGSNLVSAQRCLTGSSCHQSWTASSHWPATWWGGQRSEASSSLFSSTLVCWIDWTQPVCVSVSVRLSSGKWWRIRLAGFSESTLSWPRMVGYPHCSLISS